MTCEPLDRQTADMYAAWFKALADGTRVQIVSLLARAGRPLTVKEIVAAVPVGQSTVSEHLRQLAAVRFVLAEDRGTSRLYRINDACVTCFPTAADLVMGKPSPVPARDLNARRMTMAPAVNQLIATRSGRRSPPGTPAWPGPRRLAMRSPTATRTSAGCFGRCRVPRRRRPARRRRCGPAWAAATRSRSRTCSPGRRCWTWARAAASTCCSQPAGSARPARRTAWT